MKPNIFVGTMYCGEGEFEKSTLSLSVQENVNIFHVIVSHRQEKEAHQQLYSSWSKNKKDFDAFLQLDPDTVIRTVDVVYKMWERLKDDKHYTAIQAPLYDHMSCTNIMGLNLYKTNVEFIQSSDVLYCDRVTKNNITCKPPNIPDSLIPAGDHMQDPTQKQAFRYGLHRALKNQNHLLSAMQSAQTTKYTTARQLAIEGFLSARTFNKCLGVNYSNVEFCEALEDAIKRVHK